MKWSRFAVPASIAIAVFFVFISTSVLVDFNADFHSPFFIIPVFASIIMIPTGILRKMRTAKIAEARKRVSDFLRDLSEYTMYGTPLSEAVMLVSRNSYGPLDDDVGELASSVSLGTPVEEALRHFGNSLGDPEIERFGVILQKSGESGSNTSDVISLISQFSSQMQLLTEERDSEMRNYNLVLMISFAVFLLVMIVIDVRFFNLIGGGVSSGLLIHSSGSEVLKKIFAAGIFSEAVGIGFIIGLIRDRNVMTGFLETGSMMLISAIILLITGGI